MKFLVDYEEKRKKEILALYKHAPKNKKEMLPFLIIILIVFTFIYFPFIVVFFVVSITMKIYTNKFRKMLGNSVDKCKNKELVYQFQDDKLVICCRIKNDDHNLFTYSLLWKDIYKCDFTKKEIVFYDKNNAILEKISKQDFDAKQLKEIKQFVIEKLS